MKLQKRPFYFEETVVLPLKWHLYFNDVMKANDVHGTATILFPEDTTLHLPFLHTMRDKRTPKDVCGEATETPDHNGIY